jgi:hypothetical protein
LSKRYCAELDTCYFIRFEQLAGDSGMQLRLAPTRNNQRRGINWAEEYEFGATLGSPGAVAQLGERRRGTPKATGSSPVGSIRLLSNQLVVAPGVVRPSVDEEDGYAAAVAVDRDLGHVGERRSAVGEDSLAAHRRHARAETVRLQQ